MPTRRSPRKGTLQYWPRKRAKSMLARIHAWASLKDAKPLCFAGYKVGMTHATVKDTRPNSITKGENISMPVTIIECPPLKVIAVRLYKKEGYGLRAVAQVMSDKLDKELKRRIALPKVAKKNIEELAHGSCDDLRIVAQTQPRLTTLGKKAPELFEIALGGGLKEKFDYAKDVFGKELTIKDVFKGGEQLDTHSITKGRGFQGPVKRFGVVLRSHKSEKTKRGPGNVGPWGGNRSWTVAHAGQLGFQQRTEHNKWLVQIGEKSEDINRKGGFISYGVVRNHYVLVKGSVPGAAKRLIKIAYAIRPDRRVPKQPPEIVYVST